MFVHRPGLLVVACLARTWPPPSTARCTNPKTLPHLLVHQRPPVARPPLDSHRCPLSVPPPDAPLRCRSRPGPGPHRAVTTRRGAARPFSRAAYALLPHCTCGEAAVHPAQDEDRIGLPRPRGAPRPLVPWARPRHATLRSTGVTASSALVRQPPRQSCLHPDHIRRCSRG